MLQTKRDRRLFTHAMPAVGNRVLSDRRGSDRESDKSQFSRFQGQRYLSDFPVKVFLEGKKDFIILKSRDISQTGILLQSSCDDKERIKIGEVYRLKFKIPKGTMLEIGRAHV